MPWAHGAEVEAICRQYAELRYRLLPYTYTLAWQAHTVGLPLMRPLVMNYADDPRVHRRASVRFLVQKKYASSVSMKKNPLSTSLRSAIQATDSTRRG